MSKPNSPIVGRRTVMAGAGAVGALAAASALRPQGTTAAASQAAAATQPAVNGGYQLTEHIKLYYAKARV
jgi:ABC-type nitrate/sulfonate/bicarbonate transport system substrate-binding protein